MLSSIGDSDTNFLYFCFCLYFYCGWDVDLIFAILTFHDWWFYGYASYNVVWLLKHSSLPWLARRWRGWQVDRECYLCYCKFSSSVLAFIWSWYWLLGPSWSIVALIWSTYLGCQGVSFSKWLVLFFADCLHNLFVVNVVLILLLNIIY